MSCGRLRSIVPLYCVAIIINNQKASKAENVKKKKENH